MARSLYRLAKTWRIRASTSSMPVTLRKVSCWPAKDASGMSSAVAEERTAKLASGWPALSRSNSLRTAASTAGGSGWASIQPRICAPASARARTSSVSSDASRSLMRLPRLPALRKVRNACAVVAKPPGTRTPDWLSWLIISPREAFLPPTASTSVILSCSNGATKAVARWVDDMGRLRGDEKPVLPDRCGPKRCGAAKGAPDARPAPGRMGGEACARGGWRARTRAWKRSKLLEFYEGRQRAFDDAYHRRMSEPAAPELPTDRRAAPAVPG